MKLAIEDKKKISILLNLRQHRPSSKNLSVSFRPQKEPGQTRDFSHSSGSVDSSTIKQPEARQVTTDKKPPANQLRVSKFNPKGANMNESTSFYSISDKAGQHDESQESKLKSTLETDYENLKVSKPALEGEEETQVMIQDLKLDANQPHGGILKKRNSKIHTLPAKQEEKQHFSHFMKVLFNEKTESSSLLADPQQQQETKQPLKLKIRRIARFRMSKVYAKSVTEVVSNQPSNNFGSPNTNMQSGTSELAGSRIQSNSIEQKPHHHRIRSHTQEERETSERETKSIPKNPHKPLRSQDESVDLKASLDSVAQKPPAKPLVPVWKNRRFCITDTLMLQSVKRLKKPLEVLASRFKSTMFDCEKEIFDNPKFNDQRQLAQLSSIPFLVAGKFHKGQYAKNVQACLESLLELLKLAGTYKPSSRSGSRSAGLDVLQRDPVLLCIKSVFNCESILILLDIYFKICFHSLDLEKSEALAKVMLSLSYLHDSFLYKYEAYFMLGRVMERKRETEKALFCFTRAMQLCWEEGDLERDGLACDKIGTNRSHRTAALQTELHLTGQDVPPAHAHGFPRADQKQREHAVSRNPRLRARPLPDSLHLQARQPD